jgi:hypothetical protein
MIADASYGDMMLNLATDDVSPVMWIVGVSSH